MMGKSFVQYVFVQLSKIIFKKFGVLIDLLVQKYRYYKKNVFWKNFFLICFYYDIECFQFVGVCIVYVLYCKYFILYREVLCQMI